MGVRLFVCLFVCVDTMHACRPPPFCDCDMRATDHHTCPCPCPCHLRVTHLNVMSLLQSDLLHVVCRCALQVQADRTAALAAAKQAGFIDNYTGWRR